MEIQIESACKIIGRTGLLATALVVAGATGGCAVVKETVGEIREVFGKARGQEPAPTVGAAPQEPGAPTARSESATAIPARPLSVRAKCTARDETGYTESIRLAVDEGRVGLLEAKIEIPRRGSCGFHLSDFRQTRTEPHVELRSSTGTMCTVRMWQQNDRFTVAFNECHEKCTRGAFDYVWPIQLKLADGSCL